MPLSEKARIEVYLPDLPNPAYHNLLEALDEEFTYAFGGSTIVYGLHGSYLSKQGQRIIDRINLIFTDTPFPFESHFASLAKFAERLKEAVFDALEEEAVLVVVSKVYHSE